MNKITVVMGTTGEYSDSTEWPVKAFADRGKAEAFCLLLNDLVRGSSEWDHEKSYEFKHPLDPKCRIDYTGTSYYVFDVDFEA